MHRQTVDASLPQLWEAFTDLERVGSCFPGATVSSVDGDDFTLSLTLAMGLLKLTYDGSGRLASRDDANHIAVLTAAGSERHGIGSADVMVTLKLDHSAGTDEPHPGPDETTPRPDDRPAGQADPTPGPDEATPRPDEPTASRTDVMLTTELTVRHTPTQLAAGVGQRVSDPLVDRFLTCMGRDPRDDPGELDDAPIDVAFSVMPRLLASYGRSLLVRLGLLDPPT